MRNLILYILTALSSTFFTWAPLQAESPAQSYNRGYKQHMQGQYMAAVTHYSAAIDANPSYVQAYQMRAAALHSLKEHERALQDYSKVIELGEKYFKAVAYFNRGVVYYDTGRYHAAITDFTSSVSLDNKMAVAYVHRGIAKGRIGDKSGQVKDFVYAARYGDFEVRKWLEQHAPHVLKK